MAAGQAGIAFPELCLEILRGAHVDDVKRINALTTGVVAVPVALLLWAASPGSCASRPSPSARWRSAARSSAPAPRTSSGHSRELSGTFFTMRLDRGRTALARVPWVRKVALRRQWPRGSKSRSRSTRRSPAGTTPAGETAGEVFVAAYDGEFRCSPGRMRSPEIAGRYREWTDALAPLGLAIRQLDLSPRAAGGSRRAGPGSPLTIEIGRDEPRRAPRFVGAYGRTIALLARQRTRIEHWICATATASRRRFGIKERREEGGLTRASTQRDGGRMVKERRI